MKPKKGALVHLNSEVQGHLPAKIIKVNKDGTVNLELIREPAKPVYVILSVHRDESAEELSTWHAAEGCTAIL